jgi:hypothetical protein
MHYLDWNDLLVSYFFKTEAAGKRVHICVTPSVIEEIGRAWNSDLRDFIAAIKVGPPWVTRQGVCQKAFQAMSHWRGRHLSCPPYVGYLSVFVLAAGLDGDFAPHAYYPRLRTLLEEPAANGQYPSFNRMLDLWDDLERWANEDMHGNLGEFQADIAGGWINVGLPVAQVILTEHEREGLHTIFSEAGLDPTSSPSDEQFASLLLVRGNHRLRPRTIQLLEDHSGSSEVRELLISTALEELREWDGEFCVDGNQDSKVYGTFRLCGTVNRVARRVQLALRCKSKHDIPEEGLVLKLDGLSGSLRCLDYLMGWSSELTREGDDKPFDPALIDWSAGFAGTAADLNWRFRLPASDVRIFEEGGANAIPGIIEIPRLFKEKPFYLTCHRRAIETIEAWGRSECHEFVDLDIETGLPAGWKLYHSAGARADDLIRSRYPQLALNSTARIYFEDGVRSSRNQYFSFGLPRLAVDGADSASVYCGDALLEVGAEGRYSIPDSIVKPGRLAIEVKCYDKVLTRRNLFVNDEVPTPGSDSFRGDRFGNPSLTEGLEPSVSGAAVSGEPPPYNVFFLPDVKHHERLIFIGRFPGQIAHLTAGERPNEWSPVWAILMRRKGTALFCGDDIEKAAPLPDRVDCRKDLQEWKRVLWHRRKRIEPPAQKRLKSLWLSYQEEAGKL